MRPEKQTSFSLLDHTTSPKWSRIDPGNNVGTFASSSGKEKSTSIDLDGARSEYCVPRMSRIEEFSSQVGVNRQQCEHELNLEKTYAEQVMHKGAPPVMVTVGENVVLNQQAGACQTEAHRCILAKLLLAAQSGTGLQNLMRSVLTNPAHLVSVENSNQGIQFDRSVEVSNNSSWSQKDNKYESAYKLEQSGLSSITAGTSDNLLNADQCHNCEERQDEVQPFGSMLRSLSGKIYKHGEQNQVRSQERAAASEIEKSTSTSMVDLLSKNGSRPDKLVEDGQKFVQRSVPSKLDKTIRLSSGKPSVGDKLWDGCVHLNSSVTMSAVAFFQSGEKFPGTKWPDFIEVTGKVKLEAFEIYVQDLRRSPNRGLMVISLSRKDGSSGTEFTGMKEVSNRYKKEGRVGRAQLLEGTTLYICPCSDTIITILAKYDFLKEVVGIQDNHDSLIGCVVWRKNQFSSNSVTKTLESKCESSSEQPMASVSGSLTHQVAGEKSYPTKAVEQINKSTPFVTGVSHPSLESVARNGDESKKIELSNVPLKIIKSSSAATVPPTFSVPSSISVAQVGQLMSVPFHGPYQASSGPFLEVEASHSDISGIKHSKLRLEDKNASISVQFLPTFDDDDLPEFDFEIECGVSATAPSNNADASMLNIELQAEGSCKQDGSVSSTKAVVHTLSSPSQSLNDTNVYEYHSAPYQGMPHTLSSPSQSLSDTNVYEYHSAPYQGMPHTLSSPSQSLSDTNVYEYHSAPCQGMPHTLSSPSQSLNDTNVYKYNSAPYQGMPLQEILECLSKNPPNHNMEEQRGVQSMVTPIPPGAAASVTTTNSYDMLTKKRKLFDGGDDLPEWCPPEPYRHSLEETNRSSSAILPPKFPNSSFKNISLVGPLPVILPPSPSSIHSQFSYRPYCPAVQFPPTLSSDSPRPMPMQSSSSFSSGFNSTPALRSQSSSLDVRPPHQLPARTDWRTAH